MPSQEPEEQPEEALPQVSWGQARGGLQAIVKDTKAHRYDPATVGWPRRTLCGVPIPSGMLPGEPYVGGVMARYFRNGASDTAKLEPCQRCEAAAARRSR